GTEVCRLCFLTGSFLRSTLVARLSIVLLPLLHKCESRLQHHVQYLVVVSAEIRPSRPMLMGKMSQHESASTTGYANHHRFRGRCSPIVTRKGCRHSDRLNLFVDARIHVHEAWPVRSRLVRRVSARSRPLRSRSRDPGEQQRCPPAETPSPIDARPSRYR